MLSDTKENKSRPDLASDVKDKNFKEVDSLHPKTTTTIAEIHKKPVGFFRLMYVMADKPDIIIITLAILGSLISGAAMPMISLLLGKVLNQFNGNIENANVPSLVSGLITNFLIVGLAIFLGSGMMVFFWNITARRLINKINADYFRVIMFQDQGWFDSKNKFEFSTKVQSQVKIIENGVSKLNIKYLIFYFKI